MSSPISYNATSRTSMNGIVDNSTPLPSSLPPATPSNSSVFDLNTSAYPPKRDIEYTPSGTEPLPDASRDVKESVPRRFATKLRKRPTLICCCFLFILLLLAVIAFMIFFYGFFSYPSVQFSQVTLSPTRPLFIEYPNGVNFNFDVEFNVSNPNTFGIGLYSLEMSGFMVVPNALGVPDLNGTLNSDLFFSRQSLTPTLFPVTYRYRNDSANSDTVLDTLLQSCVSGNRAQKPRLKLKYNLKIGLSLIKFLGYKISVDDSFAFVCPFDISEFMSSLKSK